MAEAEKLAESLLDARSHLSVDALLDAATALVQDCDYPIVRKSRQIDNFLARYKKPIEELQTCRIKIGDFDSIRVIGRGAFGEVQLVRHKNTKEVFAMKLLDKMEMIRRADSAFFWDERDIMAYTDSEWIVRLYYAFQDAKFLYMIMEYMPGGDLVTLIQNYDINESWAAFYIAELVLAVDVIHSVGYIHRDLKPENVLLDRRGHVKLADFGTCVKLDQDGKARSSSAVGTPDYISPEVLKAHGSVCVFGPELDWWSVGILLYELLIGETPFLADSLTITYSRIQSHESSLEFPYDVVMSNEAENLIRRFLSDPNVRIGKNGADEIKAHPFFNKPQLEWTFDTIRNATPPVVPELSGDDDTRHFEDVEDKPNSTVDGFQLPKAFAGNQLPFIGFTYSNELGAANHIQLKSAQPATEAAEVPESPEVPESHPVQNGTVAPVAVDEQLDEEKLELKKKVVDLVFELKELQRKHDVEKENRNAQHDTEVDNLRKSLSQMEASKKSLEQQVGQLEDTIREEKEKLETALRDQAVRNRSLDGRCSEQQEQLANERSLIELYKAEILSLRSESECKVEVIKKLDDALIQERRAVESERLARHIAEETASTCDKEKTMIEVELRHLIGRHEKELHAKDSRIATILQKEADLVNELAALRQSLTQMEEANKSLSRQLHETHQLASHPKRKSFGANESFLGTPTSVLRAQESFRSISNASIGSGELDNLSKDQLIKRIEREKNFKELTIQKLGEVTAQRDKYKSEIEKKGRLDIKKRVAQVATLQQQLHEECENARRAESRYEREKDELTNALREEQEENEALRARNAELKRYEDEYVAKFGEATSTTSRENISHNFSQNGDTSSIGGGDLDNLSRDQLIKRIEREKNLKDLAIQKLSEVSAQREKPKKGRLNLRNKLNLR